MICKNIGKREKGMKKSGIAMISGLVGGIIGAASIGNFSKAVIEDKDKKVNKFKSYYNMLNQWLYIKQENRNLAEYFKKNAYKRIAVYGLGEMGSRLIDELKNTEIEVVYGIDKNVDNVFCDITAYALDKADKISDKVDAIIVTAIFAYDEIKSQLKEHGYCNIVSLEDVVFEV